MLFVKVMSAAENKELMQDIFAKLPNGKLQELPEYMHTELVTKTLCG
jgi:hypothetical protein